MCFRLQHTREHEFRGGAATHFFLRHSNIFNYSQKFYVGYFAISIELQYLMFPTIPIHYITGKTRLNFKMPFSDSRSVRRLHHGSHAHRFTKFLRILWQGAAYQFKAMPLGLNVALRVFTKIMKPVVAWLRGQDVRLAIYLDDMLLMASPSQC